MKQHSILLLPFFSRTTNSCSRQKFLLLLLACVLWANLQPAVYGQTTRYVKAGGTGNGLSWTTASGNLQNTIDASSTGDQVWVAAGTYRPDSYPGDCSSCGSDTRNYSFWLKNGVGIYGGFMGTENKLSERDISRYPSILSGDIGTVGDSTDNSYHVVISLNNDNTAVMDGFTCTGGNASGSGSIIININTLVFLSQSNGAGMYNNGSSPGISNCFFLKNSAAGTDGGVGGGSSAGAGMYNNNSSPKITNCNFEENTTSSGYGSTSGGSSSGTGMYNNNSSPQLIKCNFIRNRSSTGNGGTAGGSSLGTGMYNSNSSPQLTNCNFIGNFATTGYGGTSGGSSSGTGMYNSNSAPQLTNCNFTGNTATTGNGGTGAGSCSGTGMFNYNSSPRVINCNFTANRATSGYNGVCFGTGMYNISNSSPEITNCTFTGNTAVADWVTFGAGLSNGYQGSARITNCTFSKNTATNGFGGGIYCDDLSKLFINNSIIYGNAAKYDVSISGSGIATVAYSLIEKGYTGTGNIDAAPLFINESDPDGADNIFGTGDDGLKLKPASPAINSGNNQVYASGQNPDLSGITTDITGSARIQKGIVDMGAYENPNDIISISYKDGDILQLVKLNIRPYLQINNEGNTPVAYSNLTIRYWLTVEDFAPMTNLNIDWAQLGTNKVKMKYVKLGQPRTGAYGYIEYSFDASSGNLAAKSNSGPIQSRAAKSDYSRFDETDDYSYAGGLVYSKNNKITLYQNGNLVWGTEPSIVTPVQSLKSYSRDMSNVASIINPNLMLSNEGNKPVSYKDITMRYWFTADGSQALNYFLDYSPLGNNVIQYKFVKLPGAYTNADTYLELGFNVPDSLYPSSNTGIIQQRLAKNNWSNFNQLNDHSYKPGQVMGENVKITIYVKGALVCGTEPANIGTLVKTSQSTLNTGKLNTEPFIKDEEEKKLSVTLLNNPVVGNQVEFIVRGAGGQRLQVALINAQGKVVNAQQIGQAGVSERQSLSTNNSAAQLLFLRVSTVKEVKTVQVMRAK